MAPDTPAIPSDMAALEAFVTENDDLLALEERIGRFNIFDALDITRVELRHSNFLAWLLTPGASHGQGDLFLKALLMDMLRHARATGIAPPVSPVLLDGADLHGCDIRREWRHIDLLIVSNEPAFVVAIENKVDSGEHSNQLERYRQVIAGEFPTLPALLVFLTPDGSDASEEDWLPYSYADLHRVLSRVRRTSGGSLGSEVGVFVDQYLQTVENHLMGNKELDDLCRQLYANHRQALQLIWERVGGQDRNLLDALAVLLRDEFGGELCVINRTGSAIEFAPIGWSDLVPQIGARPRFKPGDWLYVSLEVADGNSLTARVWALETDPIDDRKPVLEALTKEGAGTGMRLAQARSIDATTSINLFRDPIRSWGDEADIGEVREATRAYLVGKLIPQLGKATGILQELHSSTIRAAEPGSA